MSAQEQDREFDRTENETANYCRAMDLADAAERTFAAGDVKAAAVLAQLAQVRATLSLAADTDRISDCVPAGASRFNVAVAGGR